MHCKAPVPGGCLDPDGSPRLAKESGLCYGHASRRYRGLPMDTPICHPGSTQPRVPCSVHGCPKAALWRGMCRTHYGQTWRKKTMGKPPPARRPGLALDIGRWTPVEHNSMAWRALNGNLPGWDGHKLKRVAWSAWQDSKAWERSLADPRLRAVGRA